MNILFRIFAEEKKSCIFVAIQYCEKSTYRYKTAAYRCQELEMGNNLLSLNIFFLMSRWKKKREEKVNYNLGTILSPWLLSI